MKNAEDHQIVFVADVDAIHDNVGQARNPEFACTLFASNMPQPRQRLEQLHGLDDLQSHALGVPTAAAVSTLFSLLARIMITFVQ